MKQFAKKVLNFFSTSKLIFKISSKIVFSHRNENNCDIESNGELHFIKSNQNTFKVIFDVGANVGEWTNFVSSVIPQATIHSFEPSKDTFEILVKKVDQSNKKNFLHNIGLGNKDEIKSFYIYGGDSTLNSAIKRDLSTITKGTETEQVKIETLDNFCLKNNINHISFLKIDTEGNELAVLEGASNYIKNGKIDAIQIEYGATYIDAGYLLKDVFKFFEGSPYTIYKMMPNNLKQVKKYAQNLENFQYANYVALLNNLSVSSQ